jgi:hypothetical protein
MRAIDRNHNKVIDGSSDERKLLIEYAAKHWGIIVIDHVEKKLLSDNVACKTQGYPSR